MNSIWEGFLKNHLQLYGHRNWIVIADSAYPAQSRQGIETVATDEGHTAALDSTLAILRACRHVNATIYTDEELQFVPEEDAPGISLYRERLGRLFEGFDVYPLPHDEIISRLDLTADKFRVLVVKTNMCIPYTSVFFELECGYWKTQAEIRLRDAMRSGRRHSKMRTKRGGRRHLMSVGK